MMFGILSGTSRDKNFGISEIKKYFPVGLDRAGPGWTERDLGKNIELSRFGMKKIGPGLVARMLILL